MWMHRYINVKPPNPSVPLGGANMDDVKGQKILSISARIHAILKRRKKDTGVPISEQIARLVMAGERKGNAE